MSSLKLRITASLAGSLLVGVLACDAGEPEPDTDFREGSTATFKTQSTDMSFKWKGCEPPWGDDPWMTSPTEEWTNGVSDGMRGDLPAHTIGAWRDAGGGNECDEGCASLELAWTGDVSVGETSTKMQDIRAIGRCRDKEIAWSIDVSVQTEILCTCG
jgi:hypothetical protein